MLKINRNEVLRMGYKQNLAYSKDLIKGTKIEVLKKK